MDFKNQNCAVCEKAFLENDDIVVCPECGTPHHRECYFSLGECKNKELHKENFSYNPPQKETKKLDLVIDDEVKEAKDVTGVFNVEFNNEESENNKDIKNTIEELFKNINGKTTDQVLLNNVPSSYFEYAVEKNQKYYMPRFFILQGTGKNKLFNAIAFLFPLAWAVYRKMYKLAIFVLCIYIALLGVRVAPFVMQEDLRECYTQCVLEDPAFMQKVSLYETGQDVSLTKLQTKFLNIVKKTETPAAIYYGCFGVSLVMNIFIGLNATKLYKNKLEKNIKKVMTLPLDNVGIKNYLKTKYGVAPIFVVALVGYIEYCFAMIIQYSVVGLF